MKFSSVLLGAAAAAFGFAGVASAQVYSNPYDGSGNGDCSWSTTCAAQVGRGDDFAAQEFIVTSAAVINGAAFEEVPGFSAGAVTDVNWGFTLADGPGGLPGTILAAGTDVVSSYGTGGNGSIQGFFNTGPIALPVGTYYFTLQGVSPAFNEFLGQGIASCCDANTEDGGLTWAAGYFCQPPFNGGCLKSIAVDLYGTGTAISPGGGTTPEPATWTLMLLGVGAVGFAMRRKAKTAALAA